VHRDRKEIVRRRSGASSSRWSSRRKGPQNLGDKVDEATQQAITEKTDTAPKAVQSTDLVEIKPAHDALEQEFYKVSWKLDQPASAAADASEQPRETPQGESGSGSDIGDVIAAGFIVEN